MMSSRRSAWNSWIAFAAAARATFAGLMAPRNRAVIIGAPASGGEFGHLEGAPEGIEVSTQAGDLVPDDRRREAEVVQLAQSHRAPSKIDDVGTHPFDHIGPVIIPD